MTIKLKVSRYNLRRPEPAAPASGAGAAAALLSGAAAAVASMRPRAANAPGPARPEAPGPAAPAQDDGFGDAPFPTAQDPLVSMMAAAPARAPTAPGGGDLDQIRAEGLTGRQLRTARRLAQKHGLPATSDFDAVRLLRAAGIDPFQKSTIMEMISAEGAAQSDPGSRALTVTQSDAGLRLPQTIKPIKVPSTDLRAEESHLSEIQRIQRDLAKRRRRKSALLMARLFFFVGLPTLLAGWYYYMVATPLYATKAEFVIQQADPAGAQGMGGLLSGTQFATSQDSIAVQGYLQSRDAMMRLAEDHGFTDHFAQGSIDPIQRLAPDATREAAYKMFQRNVKIAYDPTEGIIKMEVIAADPQVSADFSTALIGYAEEQVDHLTQRLRADQMQGARDAYVQAEAAMLTAQRKVVDLQEQFKILSSEVEVSLITAQIGQLETQLSQDRLSLAQMESNASPNAARMEPLIRRIGTLTSEIANLRSRLTEGAEGGKSLAQVQSELLVAQADVQTRQLLLAQSLQSMETARTDANRQVRYLSVSVNPIPPDEATYPRAFENTMVALLVFAGIYLMVSMTAAILREQASA
jgi:capsular polysaccharide transport system permease protein